MINIVAMPVPHRSTELSTAASSPRNDLVKNSTQVELCTSFASRPWQATTKLWLIQTSVRRESPPRIT